MGYEVVEKVGTRGSHVTAESVTAGIHSSGKGDQMTLAIGMGAQIMHKMGVSIGDRVVLLEGSDEDAGFYQIRKAQAHEAGATTVTYSGGDRSVARVGRITMRLSMLKHCKRGETSPTRRSEIVSHDVFNRVLKICIPWMLEG